MKKFSNVKIAKKSLALLVTMSMAFSLVACGTDNTETPATDETPATNDQTETKQEQ